MVWRIAIGVVLTFAGLVVVLTVGLWPRDDTPVDPDAVVVLGGAGSERTELGIELRQRYDAILVLSSSAQSFGEDRGVECGRDALCIDPDPETTIGEARTVARLADDEGWDHVTVATARFHSSRARVLFRQCLGDRVTVVGAPKPDGPVGVDRYVREAAATLVGMTTHRACWWR